MIFGGGQSLGETGAAAPEVGCAGVSEGVADEDVWQGEPLTFFFLRLRAELVLFDPDEGFVDEGCAASAAAKGGCEAWAGSCEVEDWEVWAAAGADCGLAGAAKITGNRRKTAARVIQESARGA